MNREIKFRAWDKEEEIMCYQEKGVGSFFEIGGSYLEELFYNDDVVVMQYTGLKDKNGNEIYEGDIVNYGSDIIRKKEIYWKNGGFGLESYDCSFELIGKIKTECLEVIGNIYENEELINQLKK